MNQFYARQSHGQIRFTQSQIEKLVLTSTNGHVYSYIQNVDLSSRVPMFGTEDHTAGEEFEKVNPLQRMDDALKNLVKVDDKYWESASEKEKEVFKKNPSNLTFGALLVHVYSEVQHMNIASSSELD